MLKNDNQNAEEIKQIVSLLCRKTKDIEKLTGLRIGEYYIKSIERIDGNEQKENK